jgi:hypothetical protein
MPRRAALTQGLFSIDIKSLLHKDSKLLYLAKIFDRFNETDELKPVKGILKLLVPYVCNWIATALLRASQ